MTAPLNPFLACGPNGGLVVLVFAVYGGGILSAAFFLVGLFCLFTRLRSFGMGLVTLSVLLAVGILWILR